MLNNNQQQILEQQLAARRRREERERHERNLAIARKQPNVEFPKTNFLEKIKEINLTKWPLCSDCYRESNDKEILKRKLEYQNKLLDKELEVINLKVETFKPEWIMDNFDSYLFNYIDDEKEKKLVCVKVGNEGVARKLIRISRELNGQWNYGLKIEYKGGHDYVYINRDLDKEKLFDLIRAYIFFGNTQKQPEAGSKLRVVINWMIFIGIIVGLIILVFNI